MIFKARFILILLVLNLCAALWSNARPQTPAIDANAPSPASLVLTPAVVMVRCKPGQSTTQVLTLVNTTAHDISFTMATEDVVVRDGKRSFWRRGRLQTELRQVPLPRPRRWW